MFRTPATRIALRSVRFESTRDAVRDAAKQFKADGKVGEKFTSEGEIGKKFDKEVGGPFAKDGVIGKQFEKDGALGGTTQESAEKVEKESK